jgi:hypothetical protein
MQRWRFLVVRDPKVKQTVGALYKQAWDEQVAPQYRAGEPAPGMSRERILRLLDAAEGCRDDTLTAGWLEYRNVAQEIREIREIRVI